MVEMLGTVCPAGKSRTFPALVDWVTARLRETAFAVAEMPHRPATVKARVSWPCRTGPPRGAPPRVSTTRHGATVKKSTPGKTSVSVAELLAGFGSVTPLGAATVAVLPRLPLAGALIVPIRE